MTDDQKSRARNLYGNGYTIRGVMERLGVKDRRSMDAALADIVRKKRVPEVVQFNGKVFSRRVDGYWRTRNRRDGNKASYIHIEVWNLFHPEDPLQEGQHIHHKNHNKQDNRPENLEKLEQSEHFRFHNDHGHFGISEGPLLLPTLEAAG